MLFTLDEFFQLAQKYGWPREIILHPSDYRRLMMLLVISDRGVPEVTFGPTTFRCVDGNGETVDLSAAPVEEDVYASG